MTSSARGGKYLEVPRDDLEADAGRSGIQIRASRLSLVKRRYLRLSAYVLLLCALLMIGLYYLSSSDSDSIHIPSTSFGHDLWGSSDPNLPLPRHPHYIVFEEPNHYAEPIEDLPLTPLAMLPEHCLESHIALGYPCFDNKPVKFDIVWTWVNGSDPRLQKAMSDATSPELGKKPTVTSSNPESKLYRDHDELRHSFRSVLQYFRPYVKRFHLFTSDFPFSVDEFTIFPPLPEPSADLTTSGGAYDDDIGSEESHEEDDKTSDILDRPDNRTLRLGQIPSWLRTEEQGQWRDGNVEVDVVYQSQVFQNFMGTSFNSYGIESQLPYLSDIEHNLIYLNDDFFFTAELVPSDFYTSAYGTVIRLDPGLLVAPKLNDTGADPAGEWGPLGYSSWLLSERFGSRPRPYPTHAAKSLSMPLLNEAAHIWKDEFRTTATHKFRGTRDPELGTWDAYMAFMVMHMVVERWREALLWSWVVGRIGGDEDEWGEHEQRKAWEELGGDFKEVGRRIDVVMEERKTLEKKRIGNTIAASGQRLSKRTDYVFSSLDGYPYSYRDDKAHSAWPRYTKAYRKQPLCSIDFNTCIASASSASEAFKKIAFEKPIECGDCIINALRTKSDMLGLSAFLPPPGRKHPSTHELWEHMLNLDVEDHGDSSDGSDDDMDSETDIPVSHLPLVKNWREGQFSLKAVLDPYGSVNVRMWTLRLLERYRFVIGDTNIMFLMIDGPSAARNGLNRVTKDVALLCMNDDVKQGQQMTDKIVRDWQDRRWRNPANWER